MAIRLLIKSIAELLSTVDHSSLEQLNQYLSTIDLEDPSLVERPCEVCTPSLLNTALNHSDAHPFTQVVSTLRHSLPWQKDVLTNRCIDEGYIFCELVGPKGPVLNNEFKIGFHFQTPDILYPSHSHNAEEVYFVLSGEAFWQKERAPFSMREPGSLIHHLPNQSHAIKTSTDSLLTLWGWFGDIDSASYKFNN